MKVILLTETTAPLLFPAADCVVVRTPRELESYVPDHAGTLAAEVPKPVGNKVKP